MIQWQVQARRGCTQDYTAASNRLAVVSQRTSEDAPLRVEAVSSHPQKCLWERGNVSGGSGVKIPHFQCRGHGFHPWSEN